MKRTIRSVAVGAAMLLAFTACGGSDDNPLESNDTAESGTVTVGSANFPENVLLAEMYAQALEAKDIKVERKLNIGSREVIYKQLESGGLSVLPEYNGALLAYLDKSAKATKTEEVNAALAAKLPASLKLLESSAAEDKDSIAVTKETADEKKLTSIADLKTVAKDMVLGGPPEFKTRQQGVVGLKSVYGLDFKQFKSLDVAGPITVAALDKGDVQAANLFTTDPAILDKGFVVLEDPENLFGAQNVTPVVHESADNAAVRDALNAVSTKLDTKTLGDLLKKVVSDKEDAEDVAGEWLKSAGLGK